MESIVTIAKQCYDIYGFYPISFSFCHPITDLTVPKKEKEYGTIIPGNLSTYVFQTEESYYNDYQRSKFGLTKCKGGWDCMRHLEIIANKCLPLFENPEQIPKYTMIHHPKDLYINIYKNKDILLKDTALYNQYLNRLITHFNTYLTGEGIVNYILKVTNHEDAKKVLFIDSKLSMNHRDYMSIMMHNAFKMKFKQECDVMYADNVHFLYTDSNYIPSDKRFSVACKVPSEYKKNIPLSEIIERIKNHTYDIIVYGSFYFSLDYLDLVKQYYKKDDIIGFHGGDNYIYEEEIKQGVDNMTSFVREPGRIRLWLDNKKYNYTSYQDENSKP